MVKHLLNKISAWMDFNPPGALSSKGWRLFNKEYKESAPVRYWFTHTFRHAVILPVKWKYEKITDWVRYRTTRRYHVVKTGLPPGYNDVDTKMLHVNFNMFKEFVEVEQAWHHYMWSEERREKATWCEKHMPFYRVFFPFNRPDLGIKHLEWASTLDDPSLPPHERCDHQAVAAREIMALYDWWVNKRPARKDIDAPPYDHQGLDILAALDEDFDKKASDYQAHHDAMEAQTKLEEEWREEDDEMLIRLVKIRHHLWT